MRFFGTLFFVLGIALVLLTVFFVVVFVGEGALMNGLQEVGLMAAGAAASLTVGAFARRR